MAGDYKQELFDGPRQYEAAASGELDRKVLDTLLALGAEARRCAGVARQFADQVARAETELARAQQRAEEPAALRPGANGEKGAERDVLARAELTQALNHTKRLLELARAEIADLKEERDAARETALRAETELAARKAALDRIAERLADLEQRQGSQNPGTESRNGKGLFASLLHRAMQQEHGD